MALFKEDLSLSRPTTKPLSTITLTLHASETEAEKWRRGQKEDLENWGGGGAQSQAEFCRAARFCSTAVRNQGGWAMRIQTN